MEIPIWLLLGTLVFVMVGLSTAMVFIQKGILSRGFKGAKGQLDGYKGQESPSTPVIAQQEPQAAATAAPTPSPAPPQQPATQPPPAT